MGAYQFWKRFDSKLESQKENMKDFSERMNIPYTALTQLRTKDRMPKVDVATNLARGLGTSVEYLVTGKDESISEEARAVENDPELKYLVRLCMNDRSLVSFLAHVRNAQRNINNINTENKTG